MTDDRERIREWLQQCRADEPIGPDDARYVSLECVPVPAGSRTAGSPSTHGFVSLRGQDHVPPLFDCIDLLDDQSCQLFSGYTGNGKSTELRRLAARLEKADHAVLLSDAGDYHDLFHPLSIEELLLIVGSAFGDAVAAALDEDPLRESYWSRFKEFMTREVRVQKFGVPGAAELKLAVAHDRDVWKRIRRQLEGSLGRLRDDVHAYVQERLALLKKRRPSSRGVVFVLDSFERLTGPEDRFRQTMESVVRAFAQYASFLHLPGCHVIYTVPPYVDILHPGLGSLYDRPLHVLPSVKVTEAGRPETPFAPGVAALVELVGRRIPLDAVFGEQDALVERLVLLSGGHLKTLLGFCRDLLIGSASGGLPVRDTDVDRVVGHYAEQLRQAVRPEAVRLLDTIRRRENLDEMHEDDLPRLAHYMNTQIVLCYRNGDGRFELHPLVRDHVAARAAEKAGRRRTR